MLAFITITGLLLDIALFALAYRIGNAGYMISALIGGGIFIAVMLTIESLRLDDDDYHRRRR